MLGGLLGFEFAVLVLWQWALWLAVTMQAFKGWGGVFGGLICAVQIWLFFGQPKAGSALGANCPVGPKPDVPNNPD